MAKQNKNGWIFYVIYCKCTDINSLVPVEFQRNFRKVIFLLILVIDGWSKIVLKWMPMDLTDGKSTLVQVMAWCRQTISHYLSQCWPRSLSPYDVIRPQWVKHWGREKMATIVKTTFSKAFPGTKTFEFQIKLPRSVIDIKSAFAQVMACRWIGDKPLPEPKMTQFADANVGHPV